MKNLFYSLVFGLIILQSCNCKKDEVKPKTDVTICPTVSSSEVPQSVTDSFQKKFSERTAEKWFKKDDKGFVALVSKGDEKTFLHFTKEGKFVKKQHAKHKKEKHPKEKHKHHGEHHKDKKNTKHDDGDKEEQNEKDKNHEDVDHMDSDDDNEKGCMAKGKDYTVEKTWDEGCLCELIEEPVKTEVLVP